MLNRLRHNWARPGRRRVFAPWQAACAAAAALLALGCADERQPTPQVESPGPAAVTNDDESAPAAVGTQAGDEVFQWVVGILEEIHAYDDERALRQIVNRLNHWAGTQPPHDWSPPQLLALLPEELQSVAALQQLDELRFPARDIVALQELLWFQGTTQSILQRANLRSSEMSLGELQLAQAFTLFDWTVRNIQLELQPVDGLPYTASETLLLGRGSAEDRAWIFSLLARQSGLNVALLQPADSADAVAPPPLVGLLVHDADAAPQVFLFAPSLGLAVPKAGVQGIPDSFDEIATLAECLADPALLARLDLPDAASGWTVDRLRSAVGQIEASPIFLTRRMSQMQARLDQSASKLVVGIDADALAQRFREAGLCDVQLWQLPYQRLAAIAQLPEERRRERALALYLVMPLPKDQPIQSLHEARVAQLLGRFGGVDGACTLFAAARPPDQEVVDLLKAMPPEQRDQTMAIITHLQRAKQSSSYWLGLIAEERQQYGNAEDYLAKRTLAAWPGSPWENGAHYNLARCLEAEGRIPEAVSQLLLDQSPQRPGNLLRAAWLQAVDTTPPIGPADLPVQDDAAPPADMPTDEPAVAPPVDAE